VNYELYMAEAIAEARRGEEEGELPVGAVAVLDDAMIARDHDRGQLQGDPTAHAVLLTLQATARKLGTRRLSEITIFTTLEPCAMCVGALVEARVRALVFAMHDEERGAAGSAIQLARQSSLPHQVSVVSGVREREAQQLGRASASV
jgi:tRNA(adenine34) deaminase